MHKCLVSTSIGFYKDDCNCSNANVLNVQLQKEANSNAGLDLESCLPKAYNLTIPVRAKPCFQGIHASHRTKVETYY